MFGAFPSLHSGCATIEMLFLSYLFPRMKPFCVLYVLWMWFSTMYLTHHYMIDLVGGSIYAILAYAVAQRFLPTLKSEHRTRLGYLGMTKKESGIRAYLYSIEHNTMDKYDRVINDEETAVMKEIYVRHKPEPLRLEMTNGGIEMTASPGLSPTCSSAPSSGYWSPTSEPQSPITPHSPPIHHFGFSNNKSS